MTLRDDDSEHAYDILHTVADRSPSVLLTDLEFLGTGGAEGETGEGGALLTLEAERDLREGAFAELYVEWDLHGGPGGDFFADGAETVWSGDSIQLAIRPGEFYSTPSIGPDGTPVYRARVRVSAVGAPQLRAIYEIEFTEGSPQDAAFVRFYDPNARFMPDTEIRKPAANETLRIIQTLRPDVYEYYMRSDGQLNTYRPVWLPFFGGGSIEFETFENPDIRPRPIVTVPDEYSPLERAMYIINAVGGDDWEASRVYQKTSLKFAQSVHGANDFAEADQMRIWQDWWIKQAKTGTAEGAKAVMEAYSMMFVGADLVMTANDLATRLPNGKGHWSDGLHMLTVLPFLKRIGGSAIKLYDKNDNLIGHLKLPAAGKTGVRLTRGAEVGKMPLFENTAREIKGYDRNLLGQVPDTGCTTTAGETLLLDLGVEPQFWRFAPNPEGKSVADIAVELADSLQRAGRSSEAHRIDWSLKSSLRKLKERVRVAKQQGSSVMAGYEVPEHMRDSYPEEMWDGHMVLLDDIFRKPIQGGGSESVFVVRDPATAKAWEVAEKDFKVFFGGDVLWFK